MHLARTRRAVALACVASAALLAAPVRADVPPEADRLPEILPEGTSVSAGPVEGEPDPLFDDEFFDDIEPSVYDPWEPANRALFTVNQQFDRFFWDPFTRVYQFVMPAPARRSVRRVFTNLNTPIYVVNNLLQFRFRDAGETLATFVLNTTAGAGGLFDAATELDIDYQAADFGQTLGLYGVGSGPYLVIPLLGPSTVRDGFGDMVDRAFQPLTYFIGPFQQLMWGGGMGLARRDEHHEKLEALEESAVDFYSVLRSAYTQNRARAIEKARRESILFDESDEQDEQPSELEAETATIAP
jgi:phospholipid-binding lipoprotein MlaA